MASVESSALNCLFEINQMMKDRHWYFSLQCKSSLGIKC